LKYSELDLFHYVVSMCSLYILNNEGRIVGEKAVRLNDHHIGLGLLLLVGKPLSRLNYSVLYLDN